MKNSKFTFNFRKAAKTSELLELYTSIGYGDKFEELEEKGVVYLKRQPQTIEVQTVTVEELAESEKGKAVLELLLDKVVTEQVRADFDGGKNPANGWHGGVVPANYAITAEYLLECLTPSVSSSGVAIKMADIKAFSELFAQFLQGLGKSANAIALQVGLINGKFRANLLQGLKEAHLTAIKTNLESFATFIAENAAEFTEDETETLVSVLEFTIESLNKAALSLVEVTAADL